MAVQDIPREEGELRGKLAVLGELLHWHLDAAAPGAADQVLQRWAVAPPAPWATAETLARLAAAPETWRQLLLGESPGRP